MGINVGVVGCGYWGPNIIRNIVSSSLVEKVFVCDLLPDRLAKVRARYPSVVTTQQYNDLLKNDEIQAIIIATPISTHFELCKAALEAGKHVCVEKPLTASSAQAEELIEVAEKKGLTIMVGHTFEYSPPVVKIKDLLAQGELGDLYYISSTRVNLGIHRNDGSVIWDLAPHDFSVIFYWLNELPKKVSVLGRDCVQSGLPDVAFINMEFQSGTVAQISLSWLSPTKLRQMALVGNKKMLLYNDMESMEKVKIFDHGVNFKDPESFGEFQLSYRTGDVISPKLPTFEPLGKMVEHFLDCIQNKRCPKTDGRCGLQVVKTIEACEESLRRGGQPVNIDFNTSVYRSSDSFCYQKDIAPLA